MTLYEIVPYNYDRAPIGVPTSMMLVQVEPTDRICDVHVALVGAVGAYCKDAFPLSEEPWVKCRMVDVVRIPKENRMSATISCVEADRIRHGLHVWAARTNFVGGEVLDDRRPPDTYTEWCNDDKVVLLTEVIDADGCRHHKVYRDMKEDNDE